MIRLLFCVVNGDPRAYGTCSLCERPLPDHTRTFVGDPGLFLAWNVGKHWLAPAARVCRECAPSHPTVAQEQLFAARVLLPLGVPDEMSPEAELAVRAMAAELVGA